MPKSTWHLSHPLPALANPSATPLLQWPNGSKQEQQEQQKIMIIINHNDEEKRRRKKKKKEENNKKKKKVTNAFRPPLPPIAPFAPLAPSTVPRSADPSRYGKCSCFRR